LRSVPGPRRAPRSARLTRRPRAEHHRVRSEYRRAARDRRKELAMGYRRDVRLAADALDPEHDQPLSDARRIPRRSAVPRLDLGRLLLARRDARRPRLHRLGVDVEMAADRLRAELRP